MVSARGISGSVSLRGVAEHQALVARALLFGFGAIHALRDVGRLLLNGEHHAAGMAVEAVVGVV